MSSPTTPKARPDRTWLYVGLGFVVLWGLYLWFFGPGLLTDAPQLASSGLALPADYSWTLHDLDGRVVEFAKFKGTPVFLNVWATWCPPCVRELPSIAKLAADPKLEGVAVVCVATDDSPEPVKQFVKDRNWPARMTVLHASEVPRVFTTEGIPATFLINREGRIVASEVGAADWSSPAVVGFLQKLAGSESKK